MRKRDTRYWREDLFPGICTASSSLGSPILMQSEDRHYENALSVASGGEGSLPDRISRRLQRQRRASKLPENADGAGPLAEAWIFNRAENVLEVCALESVYSQWNDREQFPSAGPCWMFSGIFKDPLTTAADHRPAGAPQRDSGTQRPELSNGERGKAAGNHEIREEVKSGQIG